MSYTFTVGDVTHTLPSPEEAAARMPGRLLRDAAMAGEEGQLRLGFQMLEACGAEPAAIDALYDMPSAEMLQHIERWMTHKEPAGVSLGESSPSAG